MNTQPLIIVVAGASSSGKGLVADLLRVHGFTAFELSEPLPRLVPPGIPFQERLDRLSKLYDETGGTILIRALLEKINAHQENAKLAIIGARQQAEVDEITKTLGKPIVIGVYATLDTRFKRSIERARPDGPLTRTDFLTLTFWEYSLGLARILCRADYLLENSGERIEFELSLKKILLNITPPLPEQ